MLKFKATAPLALSFKATPTGLMFFKATAPLALSFKATPTGLMFFKTRFLARAFASRTGRNVTDLGTDANGSRWAVKVV